MMALNHALENIQFRNWVVASLGLKYLNDGLYDFVHDLLPAPHHGQNASHRGLKNMLDLCISYESIRGLIVQIENFEQMQNIQDDILQNARFTLTDAQVIYYLSQMIAVLEDSSLVSDDEAQAYLRILRKKDYRDMGRTLNSSNPIEERLERLETKFEESEKSRDADRRELIRLKNMINGNQQMTNNVTTRPAEPRSYQACRHTECLRHIQQQQDSVVQYAKRQGFEIGQIWPDGSWRCQQSHRRNARTENTDNSRTHRCSACTVIIEGDHDTCENCGKVYCKKCFTLRGSQHSVAKRVNKNDCHLCSKLVERLSSFEVQRQCRNTTLDLTMKELNRGTVYSESDANLSGKWLPTEPRLIEQLENGSWLITENNIPQHMSIQEGAEELERKVKKLQGSLEELLGKCMELKKSKVNYASGTYIDIADSSREGSPERRCSSILVRPSLKSDQLDDMRAVMKLNATNGRKLKKQNKPVTQKKKTKGRCISIFKSGKLHDMRAATAVKATTRKLKKQRKSIKPKLLPPVAWPVYKFSCKHITSLSAHFWGLLTKCGLKEEKLSQLCTERLNRNICLKVFGKAESCVEIAINNGQTRNMNTIPKDDNVPVSILVAAVEESGLLADLCAEQPNRHHDKLVALIKDSESVLGISDEEKNRFPQGTRFSVTTTETLLHDIDELLERYVFDIVKVIAGVLQGLQTATVESDVSANGCRLHVTTPDPAATAALLKSQSNRVKMVEMLSKIEGMYCKSGIPALEKPDFSQTPDPPIDEETQYEVLAVECVIGCGESYGILHVFIDGDVDEPKKNATHDQIKRILRKKRLLMYSFKYVSKYIQPLWSCGSKIGSPSGTLGGFALKTVGEDDSSPELCALISGHVSKFQEEHMLRDADVEIGTILKPIWEGGENNLDIAVAHISSALVSKCTVDFKDELGNVMPCKLVNFETNEPKTIPNMVHIWGATSNPGLGEISIHKYNLYEDEHSPFLILTERADEPDNIFCKGGDSGAIVCADDRCGQFVHVLAMIVGKFQQKAGENQYLAVHLHAGLENLKTRHGATFTLCNQLRN